jgi:hypothetical protein
MGTLPTRFQNRQLIVILGSPGKPDGGGRD